MEQHSSARQQHRKERHPSTAGEGLQGDKDLWCLDNRRAFHTPITVPLTWNNGREFNRRRKVGQLRAPIGDLRGEPTALIGADLPISKVGVLLGEHRQLWLTTLCAGAIEGREVAPDDLARPSVTHRMVHQETQHMIRFTQPQQPKPNGWFEGEIQGLASLLAQYRHRGPQTCLRRCALYRRWGERHGLGCPDDLQQLATTEAQPRAQRRVPRDEIPHSGFEDLNVERSLNPRRHDHGVEWRTAIALRRRPHGPLPIGCWGIRLRRCSHYTLHRYGSGANPHATRLS